MEHKEPSEKSHLMILDQMESRVVNITQLQI